MYCLNKKIHKLFIELLTAKVSISKTPKLPDQTCREKARHSP